MNFKKVTLFPRSTHEQHYNRVHANTNSDVLTFVLREIFNHPSPINYLIKARTSIEEVMT